MIMHCQYSLVSMAAGLADLARNGKCQNSNHPYSFIVLKFSIEQSL